MERADIIAIAETLIAHYKGVLHVDPYYVIKVELVVFDGICKCTEDPTPTTWVISLNPDRHNDEVDVQLSVICGVLSVLLRDIPESKSKSEVISKLTHAIFTLSDQGSGDEEQENEDGPEDE
jgi:hypothetical protein